MLQNYKRFWAILASARLKRTRKRFQPFSIPDRYFISRPGTCLAMAWLNISRMSSLQAIWKKGY